MAGGTERGGIGCLGVVAIVLVTLKLAGVVAWSWWLVLAPVWGGLLFWLLIGLATVAFVVLSRDRRG